MSESDFSSLAVEALLILLLVMANGLFSGAEIAVVSSRKARLEQIARQGNRNAWVALKLANSPNHFLAAVQIGITLISILSGVAGGATLAAPLADLLNQVEALQPYSKALSLGLVVLLITFLSLVIGELVPKRIALSNPEGIACSIARPMNCLASFASPVVHILSASTDGILRLLGIRHADAALVTEDEIKLLLEQGAQAGLFEVAEQEMISRVFRLADRPIKSIMTPRVEIVWLDSEASSEENQREILDSPYSRYPVGQESIDHCLGVVAVKDLWSAQQAGQPFDLPSVWRAPLFLPENMPALEVLEIFRQSGNSLAMVTDEYGGIAGLVTLSDLIAAIVGTLHDANHLDQAKIVQRQDGSWLMDGLVSIDELKEVLHQERLPREETGQFHSLGGFIITYLGHIPQAGECFDAGNLRLEVMDMDGIRVDKVLISVNPAAPVGDSDSGGAPVAGTADAGQGEGGRGEQRS
jgi:putative hemolysin